ncbi:hypothetical protein VNO77_03172 [Canavalia gladiata]|uniref:Uncharacterized protein n=1 Tax=Canavalia gladiata TaxID=3824 RepID=A0AAN9R7W7_CANGL
MLLESSLNENFKAVAYPSLIPCMHHLKPMPPLSEVSYTILPTLSYFEFLPDADVSPITLSKNSPRTIKSPVTVAIGQYGNLWSWGQNGYSFWIYPQLLMQLHAQKCPSMDELLIGMGDYHGDRQLAEPLPYWLCVVNSGPEQSWTWGIYLGTLFVFHVDHHDLSLRCTFKEKFQITFYPISP